MLKQSFPENFGFYLIDIPKEKQKEWLESACKILVKQRLCISGARGLLYLDFWGSIRGQRCRWNIEFFGNGGFSPE